jgi:hypothetical protein
MASVRVDVAEPAAGTLTGFTENDERVHHGLPALTRKVIVCAAMSVLVMVTMSVTYVSMYVLITAELRTTETCAWAILTEVVRLKSTTSRISKREERKSIPPLIRLGHHI